MTNIEQLPRLLTVPEVAKLLGVNQGKGTRAAEKRSAALPEAGCLQVPPGGTGGILSEMGGLGHLKSLSTVRNEPGGDRGQIINNRRKTT